MGSFATWWAGAVILALLGLGVGMVIGTMHVGTVETTETIMTTYTTVGVTQQFTGLDKAMVTWVNNLVLAIILLVITLIVSRYLASGLLFVQMVLIGIVFGGHIGEYGIVPVIMYILPHGLVEIGIYGYQHCGRDLFGASHSGNPRITPHPSLQSRSDYSCTSLSCVRCVYRSIYLSNNSPLVDWDNPKR